MEGAHTDGITKLIRLLPQKSATAKAIRYALSRWEALGRFCDDGRIEIDNNAAERALRCVALGRKNFLFAGIDAGGDRAAALYSLLGTAKLNGYNPEAFLREVLTRIGEHPNLANRRASTLESASAKRATPSARNQCHTTTSSLSQMRLLSRGVHCSQDGIHGALTLKP